jgi:hypothetical protein
MKLAKGDAIEKRLGSSMRERLGRSCGPGPPAMVSRVPCLRRISAIRTISIVVRPNQIRRTWYSRRAPMGSMTAKETIPVHRAPISSHVSNTV